VRAGLFSQLLKSARESLSEGWLIQPASSGQLARRSRSATFGNERVQRMYREEGWGMPKKTPRREVRLIANSRPDCVNVTYSLKHSTLARLG
jgi:hypothetical protein